MGRAGSSRRSGGRPAEVEEKDRVAGKVTRHPANDLPIRQEVITQVPRRHVVRERVAAGRDRWAKQERRLEIPEKQPVGQREGGNCTCYLDPASSRPGQQLYDHTRDRLCECSEV